MHNPDSKWLDIIFTYLESQAYLKEHLENEKIVKITLDNNKKIDLLKIRISPSHSEREITFITKNFITLKITLTQLLISQQHWKWTLRNAKKGQKERIASNKARNFNKRVRNLNQ